MKQGTQSRCSGTTQRGDVGRETGWGFRMGGHMCTHGWFRSASAAKSRQSCPTLCDPIGGSPSGSRPWDSPGKNTGVGCHFLLQCMKVKSESEVAQLGPTLRDPTDCSLPGSSIHGIFQARVLEWGAIAFSGFMFRYGINHHNIVKQLSSN